MKAKRKIKQSIKIRFRQIIDQLSSIKTKPKIHQL